MWWVKLEMLPAGSGAGTLGPQMVALFGNVMGCLGGGRRLAGGSRAPGAEGEIRAVVT